MSARAVNYVTFISPGTFFGEKTSLMIEAWDTRVARRMADAVIERHGARPYCFYFERRVEHGPIPDGEGGFMDVRPKVTKKSGIYFFGKPETLDELEARNDPKEATLRANMKCNGWPIVAVATTGWSWAQPFEEGDFCVDEHGDITERGDDPKHREYRAERLARDRDRPLKDTQLQ